MGSIRKLAAWLLLLAAVGGVRHEHTSGGPRAVPTEGPLAGGKWFFPDEGKTLECA